jgi:hypothetical protein
MRLELGTEVRCSDDVFGKLADVVIDPIEKRLTHLVAEPKDGDGGARLVPIELVAPAVDGESQGEITLACTVEEALALDLVHEFAYLRLGEALTTDPNWDVGIQDVLVQPYYEGSEISGFPTGYVGGTGTASVTYDRVPKGEVEIRRSSAVATADNHFLGKVDGFVVDEDHITHFVLEHGHLWGKREVTIPIGAVVRVENDEITLALTKAEVKALPSMRVHR